MSEKATGYSLLITGILVIFASAISVFSVFTKRATPVQLFNFPPISINLSSLTDNPQTPSLNLPPAELVPANVLNDSSNLFAHLFLMGFIASVGQKIASLGVTLLRPIEVKLKTKEGQTNI